MRFEINTKPMSEKSWGELERLRQQVANIWDRAQHPHFTHHNLEHTDSILRKLEDWLARTTLGLSEDELFILMSAAYLHDIGMQCENAEFLREHAGLTSNLPLGAVDLQNVRKSHHKLSFAMVKDACNSIENRLYKQLQLSF